MNQKWLQRGLIYPTFILVANLGEEIASYYTKKVNHPHWKTIAIITCILLGFGLLAYILDIIIKTSLRQAHRSSRRSAGIIGEAAIVLTVAGGLYWAYYQLMNDAVTALIPPALR